MATAKDGDRVTATLSDGSKTVVGLLRPKGQTPFECVGERTVVDDECDPWYVLADTVALSVKTPLVGPAPVVDTPTFVSPFTVDGSSIHDATGRRVMFVPNFDSHSEPLFAIYVRDALNAKVEVEMTK